MLQTNIEKKRYIIWKNKRSFCCRNNDEHWTKKGAQWI